ncbi:MAG: hypothetical protein H7A43_12650, partial [Verrucomicrobia bacterium]|nr:hypothetical protein [Verrucomicrobiota bacterium]MCP5489484.1 hypothetical protein [Verrucomicrobiota bacterium]
PMPWMRRWRSVAWGTVLIFGLNLLRIVSLFYVMMYWPAFMDLAHGLIWQSIMVLSACLFVLFQMNAPAARSQPEPLRP